MVLSIRDDDVNHFTDPGELESAYKSVWDFCPPTFSVITHVKGDWKFWVKEIYRQKHAIDWIAWGKDDKVFPIDTNHSLVNFLKEKHSEGKLDLSLHAVHHRNDDPILPAELNNNYVRGAEFFTNQDLTNKVKLAIDYLSKTFNTKIEVFTPPQNLMSLKGYRSVIKNHLSIIGSGISFWKKELTSAGIANTMKVASFKLQHPGFDYPHVLHFKSHSEIVHHYPLHPTTKTQDLVDKFEAVRQFDGVFVLSTHYHEFETPLIYDNTKLMKDVFSEFMDYVVKIPNVRFSGLTEICRKK